MKLKKSSKRIFIIEIEILENVWDYKKGQILNSVIISNNIRNACFTFEDWHCGGEYPSYKIKSIEDTLDNGFFIPNINSKNLL